MQINVLPVDASSFRLIIEVSVQFSPAEKIQILNIYQQFSGRNPGTGTRNMEQISIIINKYKFVFYFWEICTAGFS